MRLVIWLMAPLLCVINTQTEDEEEATELFHQIWDKMDAHVTEELADVKHYIKSKISRLYRQRHKPVVDTSRSAIGFHAVKSEEEVVEPGAKIIFDDVIYNQGNGYNPDTGRFVAPKDGMYVFSSTIRVEKKKATIASIVVNGEIVGELFADAREARRTMGDSGSTTVVIHLQTGDRVSVKTAGHWSSFVDANWSSFSGFRVG